MNPGVSCDVQGCETSTRVAREFDHEQRRVWLMVCDDHARRMDGGEPYTLVSRSFDLGDPTGNRPVLFMET